MLSERYRPKTWAEFVGQPVIDEIREACADDWLFDGCGERWLFESDSIAGCGKTSAAYVTARELGCGDFAIDRIDSRACTVADLRKLSDDMRLYGWGGNGRRCYIIDEIQHLNRDCQRMLLGILENLPTHVIIIGTTTSVNWAAVRRGWCRCPEWRGSSWPAATSCSWTPGRRWRCRRGGTWMDGGTLFPGLHPGLASFVPRGTLVEGAAGVPPR